MGERGTGSVYLYAGNDNNDNTIAVWVSYHNGRVRDVNAINDEQTKNDDRQRGKKYRSEAYTQRKPAGAARQTIGKRRSCRRKFVHLGHGQRRRRAIGSDSDLLQHRPRR